MSHSAVRSGWRRHAITAIRGALASLILFAALSVSPDVHRSARAATFGMTPSHVVGLWTNVNNCLLAAATTRRDGQALYSEMEAMKPAQFDGKKPADVLAKVAAVRAKLDTLRATAKLAPTSVYHAGDTKITPSHVFLNSGHVLNALVDWLVRHSDRDLLVSPFYADQALSDKTPNHAFAMVDLAERRLDALLRHKGA